MKILIYGSTHISRLVCEALMQEHEVVGYVPSKAPIFPGVMPVPIVPHGTSCDIKLSVQYDVKILDLERTYNLHTGLLPEYGGCDILYHTLENRATEQGLTLHRITGELDAGGIVSKITYPVLPGDTALDLYKRLCTLAPGFCLSAMRLLPGLEGQDLAFSEPQRFKRGKVSDVGLYEATRAEITKYIESYETIR